MEYNKVSKEIAALKIELSNKQNKLSEFHDRAKGLKPVAENTVRLNNQSGGKATGVNLYQTGEKKDNADKSKNKMDARNTQREAEKQQIKVDKISRQIEKKQSRLQQLIDIRFKINFMTRPFN